MSSTPNFPSNGTFLLPAWIFVVLFAAALLGLMAFIAYRIAARHRRVQTFPVTTSSAGKKTLSEVARCWVAPTGVMAVFVALSGEFGHEFERWFSLTPFANIPVAVEPHQSSAKIDDLSKLSKASETDTELRRPGWIDEGNTPIGDVQKIVLSSGLWSTEAEANRELLPRVASIVRTDFAERHKSLFDRPTRRFLSDERLAHIAVKREYLELVTKKTGSMELPMCRLWQQIEISPMVRTEIYPAWKSSVLGNRVVIIGIVLSLMTLVANAVSLFVKLKRLPNRSTIYASVVAATAAGVWIAGDLLLAMRM